MVVVATQEEIIEGLAVDYARVAHLGWPVIVEEHPDVHERIRTAGARLNELGGHAAMRDAAAEIYNLGDGGFPTGADFNRLWDGIGVWRA